MTAPKRLIDRNLLASLEPLRMLDTESLNDLAGKTYLEPLRAGQSLFRFDQNDDCMIFVITGSVEIMERNGESVTISGGTPEALRPLSPLKPRRTTANTKTDAFVVRINDGLLDMLSQASTTAGFGASNIEVEEDSSENALFAQLYDDYSQNKLAIPSMPDIALRVRKAIQDDKKSVDDIAKIIQADAPMAVRIVQVANSALYRGKSDITSLRMAVTRLGLSQTRNLVFSFALKQLFQTKAPLLRQRMIELWRHTTLVAALSAILGRMRPGFDVDRALLAGLIHDIGVLPILGYAEQYPDLASERTVLETTIKNLRGQLGAMVLRLWQFDEDLINVALDAEDWSRDSHEQADYCDIVIIAQLHSYVGTPMMTRLPAIDQVPAYAKLALGELGPRKSLKVLEEAREEVSEVHKLLMN